MVKELIKKDCKAFLHHYRVSYHYLTFNLGAFIKYILLITVHSRMVHWPETVNIPNISCIMLEYTLLTICMNLCYVGNLLEDG